MFLKQYFLYKKYFISYTKICTVFILKLRLSCPWIHILSKKMAKPTHTLHRHHYGMVIYPSPPSSSSSSSGSFFLLEPVGLPGPFFPSSFFALGMVSSSHVSFSLVDFCSHGDCSDHISRNLFLVDESQMNDLSVAVCSDIRSPYVHELPIGHFYLQYLVLKYLVFYKLTLLPFSQTPSLPPLVLGLRHKPSLQGLLIWTGDAKDQCMR